MDDTINTIWLGMLDSERLSRYYRKLSDRMRRNHFILSAFILLSSTAAIASLMSEVYDWIAAIFLLVVAATVIWHHLGEYSKRAALANVVAIQCDGLASEWKHLWLERDSSVDALAQASALEQRMTDATNLYDGPQDDALNVKCAEEPMRRSKSNSPTRTTTITDAASPRRPASPAPPPPPKPTKK